MEQLNNFGAIRPAETENYYGIDIDGRMRARGNSYPSYCVLDDKKHYATIEILTEKQRELLSLQEQYKSLYQAAYDEGGRERLGGEDVEMTLQPLESLSARIRNLHRFISTAEIVKENGRREGRVCMLSRVTVRVHGMNAPMTIRIVGENEAGPGSHDVSCVSPVGKALLGRHVGESVDVKVGARTIRYSIVSL